MSSRESSFLRWIWFRESLFLLVSVLRCKMILLFLHSLVLFSMWLALNKIMLTSLWDVNFLSKWGYMVCRWIIYSLINGQEVDLIPSACWCLLRRTLERLACCSDYHAVRRPLRAFNLANLPENLWMVWEEILLCWILSVSWFGSSSSTAASVVRDLFFFFSGCSLNRILWLFHS